MLWYKATDGWLICSVAAPANQEKLLIEDDAIHRMAARTTRCWGCRCGLLWTAPAIGVDHLVGVVATAVDSRPICIFRSRLMRCPYCASDQDRVVDSRPADDGAAIRRRRHCAGCGQRFSTYERVEMTALVVRKRDGRTQPFDPERVADGMRKATANLDLDPVEVRTAAARVQGSLRALGVAEVGSDTIGEHVLDALRALHPVAYVRFASVHESFTSPEDFARAVARLDAERRGLGEDATPAAH